MRSEEMSRSRRTTCQSAQALAFYWLPLLSTQDRVSGNLAAGFATGSLNTSQNRRSAALVNLSAATVIRTGVLR